MRGPIVAPTPILTQIENDLDITPTAAGLITTVPVLMFALLTPIAALVIRRAGAEFALLLSLSGVLAGTFIRALPGFTWMLAGMLVIGAAVTIGNVVIPVIIRRDVPPARVGIVTASYAAMLNAGSLITSLGTVPLADLVGWSSALLLWSVITLAGVLLWSAHLVRERRAGIADRFSGEPGVDPRLPPAGAAAPHAGSSASLDPDTLTGPMPVIRGHERSMLRRPITWLLVGAFAGQTTAYYGLSTWLPTLLGDTLGADPTAAGALASIFQGVGILGAFVVPLLARFTPAIVPAIAICASWLLLSGGMLLAPSAFVVWASFGAIAHAGGFVVIFTTLVSVSRSDSEAAGLSAVVQGGGYAVGALGAPVMGALHEASGGWTVPLIGVLIVAISYCVLLLSAVAVARRERV